MPATPKQLQWGLKWALRKVKQAYPHDVLGIDRDRSNIESEVAFQIGKAAEKFDGDDLQWRQWVYRATGYGITKGIRYLHRTEREDGGCRTRFRQTHDLVELDATVESPKGHRFLMGEMIPDPNAVPLDAGLDESILRDSLRVLTVRERRVIEGIYWRKLSQAAIGEEIGCSQMHVSRIHRHALKKLRNFMGNEDNG